MATVEVKGPVCGGVKVIKHGSSESGKQPYYCKDSVCKGESFRLEHNHY